MPIFDQQFANMTAKSIAEQINAIREITQKAAASPETALDFLRRAGIADTSSFTVKKNAGHSARATRVGAVSAKAK